MKQTLPHTLVIGGGFAGLNAACVLGRLNFPVTLIDKQNFHLFQPLLYQVATGFLAPGDIASPLRAAVSKYKTVKVIQDEIIDIKPQEKKVLSINGSYSYENLVIASGMENSYFGNDDWMQYAGGLKSIEDSVKLRSKILSAFEAAERATDLETQLQLLTFCIVGGGPTGVELAGAIAELASCTLKNEFRNFDPKLCKIMLFEAGERILSAFHPKSSSYVEKILGKLDVEVHKNTFVKNIEESFVDTECKGAENRIITKNVIWAAGVKTSALTTIIQKRTDVEMDRSGRIKVEKNLTIKGFPEIFILGDIAYFEDKTGNPLPGLAPVAMQQGKYCAKYISGNFYGTRNGQFSYLDKGNMAVIGKGRAVAEAGKIRLRGFFAWIGWAFIHIYFLIEFENKLIVFMRWAWNYITNKRGSRLITKQ